MSRRGLGLGGEDEERFAPKRRGGDGSEVDLDITPMIDVTFLLLIFFMVTSNMQPTGDLDVPVARFGIGVDTREATVVRIKAPPSPAEPPILLLGRSEEQVATLDDVRREVEDAVRDQRPHVIVKADREVPNGFVQTVARTITAVDGAQFFVGVRDTPAPTGDAIAAGSPSKAPAPAGTGASP